MFELSGKTVLITGSGRGIGLTLAEGLAGAGASVILNGRNEELLVEAVGSLEKKGFRASCSVFDVGDEKQVLSAIERMIRDHGVPDVLVNNAGINIRSRLAETRLRDWQRVLQTNLTGAFLVSREVVKGMIARNGGKIINICSLMSELGRDTTGAYASAKGGLKMLTRAMCTEWARFNIQSNGIGPGYFLTEMTRPLEADRNFNAWITARTPAGRWGKPEELVGTAVFLSSGASDFINGQVIYVDGGLLATL